MSDHFDVQRRSSNNKMHRGLAARFSPTASFDTETSSTDSHSTPSASVQVISVATPTTTAQDAGKNTPTSVQTSSTSSAAHGNTSTTPTTTSSASTASSATSSATTSTVPTSAAPAVVTVHSTSLVNSPSASLWTSSVGSATTPSTAVSATSTSSSSSVDVTAVVGGIAGTLAGLAILGFLVMWLMRRRKENYDDDFNASIFRRQSAILVDDPPAPSHNPRPPTMIERHLHNASPALAAQRNFSGPGSNFYGGYGQQSLGPGEVVQPAYGQPVMGYGDPGQLARQPSNAAFLTRQPSAMTGYGNPAQLARQPSGVTTLNRQRSAAGYGATPEDNEPHYVDLNRSSVTPFQAAQYAAISRHLNDMEPRLPRTSDDLNLPPLPSPFDNPPQGTPQASTAALRAPSPVHFASGANTVAHSSETPAPRTREVTTDANRPSSAYTVYEDGDAYGGI
ncbi:hypothetical protein F5J12DRAFT_892841 [Pisolithus orientalis]|uniref:uncharacterized protein n=1 Tax=Pisolithus orientalis TaxID=936130 RepID=UPI0022256ABB|nr:uncharacterized protein F5J12DRAFT_892841 [Pisolithus orientalis]KAI6006659.1 hypothetical protein F5J12DRAFT_892841 [Pisolithus orientalis]